MPLVTVITGWTLGKKSTGAKGTLLTVFFLKTAGGLTLLCISMQNISKNS